MNRIDGRHHCGFPSFHVEAIGSLLELKERTVCQVIAGAPGRRNTRMILEVVTYLLKRTQRMPIRSLKSWRLVNNKKLQSSIKHYCGPKPNAVIGSTNSRSPFTALSNNPKNPSTREPIRRRLRISMRPYKTAACDIPNRPTEWIMPTIRIA